MKPIDFNVPEHDEWRVHQLETVQWTLDNSDECIITCQPTGSGKSAYAKAMTSRYKTVILTRTKFLQAQYADQYNAVALQGRANYKCIHPNADGVMCDECLHSDEGMDKCAYVMRCEYMSAKYDAIHSPFSTTNYSYWQVAKGFRAICKAEMLVLDEAHGIPDLVTQFVGTEISARRRQRWGLPRFPTISPDGGDDLLLIKRVRTEKPTDKAVTWLYACISTLNSTYRHLQARARNDAECRKRARRYEYFIKSLTTTIESMRAAPNGWYIRSGPGAMHEGYSRVPGFVCKPLTAMFHAPRLFMDHPHKTICMSATIDPVEFSEELGIDEYDFRAVPNQFEAKDRQIHVLDCPSMGAKAKESDFKRQADLIAEAIGECPPEWSGLIHVSRKKEVYLLAERLRKRGLNGRIWTMHGLDGMYIPTDEQVRQWHKRLDRVENSICISHCMTEGYDGRRERINVVAKILFPLWGSPGSYEAAWRSYSRSRYQAVAAKNTAQALGRTRRGAKGDYGEENGRVFIADGSIRMIRKRLPADVQESLTNG